MLLPTLIDTAFDFRTDASGKDADSFSPTLRVYHRSLWSKPLPCGRSFELSDGVAGAYLHHRSELGEFMLASDSVIPTFTRWTSMKHIIGLFPEVENESFRAASYTIGGMMIFPANKVDGKQTINGARGFNRKISDRFDLTLECIRRHYAGQASPLGDVLERYASFFALFRDFRGYVDFFLLQDLVTEDCSAVRFFMDFDNFASPSAPQDESVYRVYRRRSLDFVVSRNARIASLASERP